MLHDIPIKTKNFIDLKEGVMLAKFCSKDPTFEPWVLGRIILLFMFCGSTVGLEMQAKFSQPSHLRD